ncbi:MAG TPA: thiosulfate oxidation carrier complex protein SoxZ, partial [Rubrivivax sp.]|nr:thiosulfate oxidation carrier complex protein SoxZ [Rubrivivax sp.]
TLMATRALLTVPAATRRGELAQIRLLVQHPMETGYRTGSDGQRLQRDIIRRIECRLDGELVFAADTFAAVAANPYIAFTLRVSQSGTLVASWSGDNGFAHSESASLNVTA